MRQSLTDAHTPVEAEIVVLRLPHRVSGVHADRRVIQNRCRGESLLSALGIHRRDIDERLEQRSRLPPGLNGAIELRLGVIAATYKRFYVSRARLDGEDDSFQRDR